MEHFYPQTNKEHSSEKASRETVKFLLDYSRSLSIVNTRGLVFERNLN